MVVVVPVEAVPEVGTSTGNIIGQRQESMGDISMAHLMAPKEIRGDEDGVHSALMQRIELSVLSGQEEAALELADAAARHGVADPPPRGESLLFLSMGGMSTQAICVAPDGTRHVASFGVGKGHFRKDAAAVSKCAAEMERLLAFVGEHLG